MIAPAPRPLERRRPGCRVSASRPRGRVTNVTRGAGDPLPGPFPLPARSEPVLREDAGRRLPGRSCYLFDVDDELGARARPADAARRAAARHRARAGDLGGRVRSDPAADGAARGPRPAADRRHRRARRRGRRPHRLRARRGRRPARAVEQGGRRRPARHGDPFARARDDADRGARRGVRRADPALAADPPRRSCAARSGGRCGSTSSAPRPAIRAPTCGSRSCSGTSPSAGGSSSSTGSSSRCRSPTG